ncbi:hypothetical protein FM112_08565 [Gulosibacter sp. 10]|nr:hypothetical protein FM112_08565 [Gulosibacter sp. 10]
MRFPSGSGRVVAAASHGRILLGTGARSGGPASPSSHRRAVGRRRT